MKAFYTLMVAICLFGMTTKAQSTPDELADLFFKEFAKEGNLPIKSIKKIKDNFTWAQTLIYYPESTERMTFSYDRIGRYNESQLINKIKLTDKYFIYSYAVIYGVHPLRFKLHIFNGDGQWKISQLKVDRNFEEDAYSYTRPTH